MFALNAIELFGTQLDLPFIAVSLALVAVHIAVLAAVLVCLFLLRDDGGQAEQKRSFFDPPAQTEEAADSKEVADQPKA